MVKELDPVVNAVPPLAAAYQSIVSPPPGVAEIVTVPVPHLDAWIATGTAGAGFTVNGTLLLPVHPKLLAAVVAV